MNQYHPYIFADNQGDFLGAVTYSISPPQYSIDKPPKLIDKIVISPEFQYELSFAFEMLAMKEKTNILKCSEFLKTHLKDLIERIRKTPENSTLKECHSQIFIPS